MEDLDTNKQLELMTHIREVIRGNKPFEHPGAPTHRPGQRYEPTEVDLQFDKETRADMSRNAFFRGLVWGATPALLFNIPQVRSSWMFRNQKSALPAILICGTLGYVKGSLENGGTYAKRRFMLDSPIGKESRYKLHQMNPRHEWLRGFEHEFERNRMNTPQEPRERRRVSRGYGRPGRNPSSEYHQGSDDGFTVDDWFGGGSEGGKIPGGQMRQQQTQEVQFEEPSRELSRAELYRQKRAEFDRNRGDFSRGDYSRTEYPSQTQTQDWDRSPRRDAAESRESRYRSRAYSRDPPPRASYGQSDDDFVSSKDFQMDDDQFVSSTPRRGGQDDKWY